MHPLSDYYYTTIMMTYKNFTRYLLVIIPVIFVVSCAQKYQLTPIEPAPEPVRAENGMVVAAHPLAAEAGVSVLRDGGNAVDAALATLFMLNVVEPHASGLGGGGFALVKMIDQDPKVVTYREYAPKEVDASFYYDPADSLHLRMKSGGAAVAVPGAAAGWAMMFDKWATLPLDRLSRDAIDAAENGFIIDPTLAGQISSHYENFLSDSLLRMKFLKDATPPGQPDEFTERLWLPYDVGDTLRQEYLARTLKYLTKRGLRSFYRGLIAEAIINAVQADGSQMKLSDLESFRAEIAEPVIGKYEGFDVLSVPPPSRGGTALIEALNLYHYTASIEGDIWDPSNIHMVSQCTQQAYVDAIARVGDPKKVRKDWKSLLSMNHAPHVAGGISRDAKPTQRTALPDTKDSGNTSHLVVVDQWGNAVSLTQSINYFFGAGVIAENTGILLNNHMADFDVPPIATVDSEQETSINLIESRKRPSSFMTPAMVLKDDKVCLIVGTPGASRITAAVAQIMVAMIHFDLNISEAIDYPRFFPIREHLVMENRFSLETIKALKKTGYTLHMSGPYATYFGGAHGISLPPLSDGIEGAADKRRGGAARGY